MARPRKMTAEEIEAGLKTLDGWDLAAGKLHRTFTFPDFVAALRKEWEKRAAKSKKFKISLDTLGKLAKPYADRFLLIPEQKPLTPESGGRAKYATPTLKLLRKVLLSVSNEADEKGSSTMVRSFPAK